MRLREADVGLLIPPLQLEQRLTQLPRNLEIVAYCRGSHYILSFEAVAVEGRQPGDRGGGLMAATGRNQQMNDQTEGGCLCGAVRFVAKGAPIGVAWCHCNSCRKHSGAPVSVFVAFRRDAYEVIKGEITKFNSSPGRWRGFCARCGSTLTCEGEASSPETHFHIGSIDQAARLRPTRHIFPEERLPWLHLSENFEQAG